MSDIEATYVFFAKRMQRALENDDLDDLIVCAQAVDVHRVHFVEEDEDTGKRIVKPSFVYAAEHSGVETLAFLLQNACDINVRDTLGNTALLIAVANEREEVVDFLLKQEKIDLSISNSYGETIYSLLESNPNKMIQHYLDEKTQQISAQEGFVVKPDVIQSLFKN